MWDSFFQQAAGADQHIGFSGKSKDIMLTMSRRDQLWSRAALPYLSFIVQFHTSKSASLKIRRDSDLTHFITWEHIYSWLKCPQAQPSKLTTSSGMYCAA